MPLNKKRHSKTQIIIWILIAVLVLLMIVSFPATQNVTEIVLYP